MVLLVLAQLVDFIFESVVLGQRLIVGRDGLLEIALQTLDLGTESGSPAGHHALQLARFALILLEHFSVISLRPESECFYENFKQGVAMKDAS